MDKIEIFEKSMMVRLAEFIYKSNPTESDKSVSLPVNDSFFITSKKDNQVRVMVKREIVAEPNILLISVSCELDLTLKDKNNSAEFIEQSIKRNPVIFNMAFGMMSSLISSTTAMASKTPIITPPVFLSK